jgi:hypothetical protein
MCCCLNCRLLSVKLPTRTVAILVGVAVKKAKRASHKLRIACLCRLSYVAIMDERNVGGDADEEVDPVEYGPDLEDEGGEKTGRDLEFYSEDDPTKIPEDGDDEKVQPPEGGY